MFKGILKTLSIVVAFSATQAAAVTYEIDGINHGYSNGFQSSLFHDQDCGRMCSFDRVDTPTTASGTWDTESGVISFVMGLFGGGSVTVTGKLLLSDRGPYSTDIGYEGVYTDPEDPLTFAFSSDSDFGAVIEYFSFENTWFNAEANGHNGSQISLWGDNGRYSYYEEKPLTERYCSFYNYMRRYCAEYSERELTAAQSCEEAGDCYGLDIRLTLSPAPVPLPASFGLLALGVGGLAGLRRTRRRKQV